jgi:glucose-6-phosphate 1-dehydrogenase
MAARTIPVSPFDLIIFGATGDLAKRKIFPSLYFRMKAGQMPQNARIIGAARGELSDKDFVELVTEALLPHAGDRKDATLKAFLKTLSFVTVDALSDDGWAALKETVEADPRPVRVFYLSVGPSIFDDIASRLTRFEIATSEARIVVEKPLGHDLASARELNAQLAKCFDEKQIYRIDHYLGKETVQNLMVLRFGNALFEPLWNNRHIDHVQITVAESLGVEGRGGYYDKSGAMRDMVQNHLMQLLCLTTMEPPSHYNPDAVRDEKLKVIRALKPVSISDTVRGQYAAGDDTDGFLADVGDPESTTSSFVALKASIANWRWAGVPIYLRTGKMLKSRISEIAVIFKDVPHAIFPQMENQRGNALIIRLQPDEGITLRMTIKEPGPGGLRLSEVPLDMSFKDHVDPGIRVSDAYERLIMDVIRGDQTLFMRGDEVEAAWQWVDPVLYAWSNSNDKPETYEPGSNGPRGADKLLEQNNHKWRDLPES